MHIGTICLAYLLERLLLELIRPKRLMTLIVPQVTVSHYLLSQQTQRSYTPQSYSY